MKKVNSFLESFGFSELNSKQLKHVYGGTVPPPPTSTPSSGGSVTYGGGPPSGYNPPPTNSGDKWDGDSDTKPRSGNQEMP